jgi:hypothetical protein
MHPFAVWSDATYGCFAGNDGAISEATTTLPYYGSAITIVVSLLTPRRPQFYSREAAFRPMPTLKVVSEVNSFAGLVKCTYTLNRQPRNSHPNGK